MLEQIIICLFQISLNIYFHKNRIKTLSSMNVTMAEQLEVKYVINKKSKPERPEAFMVFIQEEIDLLDNI